MILKSLPCIFFRLFHPTLEYISYICSVFIAKENNHEYNVS